MTLPLTLLHSTQLHCRIFDRLRDRIAPPLRLEHRVRADWLARVRSDGMTRQLAAEMRKAVETAPGRVLCTCTSLGEAADEAGAIRIDRPMMAAAAQSDGPILLVCALGSAAGPSRALLQSCLEETGRAPPVTTLVVEEFWPLFEAGQVANFCAAVAAAALEAVQVRPDFRTVVLAQASMADAAHLLGGLGPDVLAAPELALRCALDLV